MPHFRTIAAAAAALALALPAGAPAQVRDQPIEEVAADLAYGFCPLFLAGQFSLTGPELAERGFGSTVLKQPHPRLGEINVVKAKLKDGQIGFGGAAGKACMVSIDAPNRAAVVDRLHKSMSLTGLDFQPVGPPQHSQGGVAKATMEEFRAPVEKQYLYLQLIQFTEADGTGAIVAQLFAMDR